MPPSLLSQLAEHLPEQLRALLPLLRLPDIPKSATYAALALLLLNWKSLPFVWHLRVWTPALLTHFRANPRLSLIFRPPDLLPASATASGKQPGKKVVSAHGLLVSAHAIGLDIFEDYTTLDFFAGWDDCDYNGHLSNSSYAKNLDIARMTHLAQRFPSFHHDGGWIGLGGASYTFYREIPRLTPYKIRIGIAGWDEKWAFVVGKFVFKRKRSAKSSSSPTPTVPSTPATAASSAALASLISGGESLPTPSASGANTPLPGTVKPLPSSAGKTGEMEEEEVLACISVSKYVFKSGRKTIPPGVIIAMAGYGSLLGAGTDASTGAAGNWDRAEKLRREHKEHYGKKAKKNGVKSRPVLRRYGDLSEEGLVAAVERSGDIGTALEMPAERYFETRQWEPRRKAFADVMKQVKMDGALEVLANVGGP